MQVAEIIRKDLSQILTKTSFHDPILKNSNLITVSEVRMTPDLKLAKVMIYPLNLSVSVKNQSSSPVALSDQDKDRQKIQDIVTALNRASGFIRNLLAKSITQKFTPALAFYQDRRFDDASQIEKLLRDSKSHDQTPQ